MTHAKRLDSASHQITLIPVVPEDTTPIYRESLTSLFRRTCANNSLPVSKVRSLLVQPLIEATLKSFGPSSLKYYLINHGGALTSNWASALEILTGQSSLQRLTFHSWNSLLEQTPLILLDDVRKWCPECYAMMIKQARPIFDRLLWTVRGVEICPIHKVMLERTCKNCGKGPFQELTGDEVSGFCQCCHAWLGGAGIPVTLAHSTYPEYLNWIAQSASGLLDTLPSELSSCSIAIPKMISEVVQHYFDGNLTLMAQFIDRSKSLASQWRSGIATPSWGSLCDISYAFSVPLRDLITGNHDSLKSTTPRKLPRRSADRRSNRNNFVDWNSIRNCVKGVKEGDNLEIDSTSKFAAYFNIDRTTLRHKMPNEYARLVEIFSRRRMLSAAKRKHTRDLQLKKATKQATANLIARGIAVTRRSLENELEKAGNFPYRTEITKLLILARELRDKSLEN